MVNLKAYAPSKSQNMYEDQAIVSLLMCGLDIASRGKQFRNPFIFYIKSQLNVSYLFQIIEQHINHLKNFCGQSTANFKHICRSDVGITNL